MFVIYFRFGREEERKRERRRERKEMKERNKGGI
jgi:hypothetical protein